MGCFRPFLRLGICVFSLGVSWCFLRLELFTFLLGFLKVFRIFTVRIWSVFCVIGLGSLVRAFYIFLVLPTPRSVLGPGLSLLLCFSSVPPTPHSVRGHGLGNRVAKQRHGTVGFSCSFFPADALLSSELGGGQGKLATHTVAQDCMFCLLTFVMHVVLFSLLICVFG